MRKTVLLAALMAVAIGAFAATPAITGVTAQQRYPWNGKVDILYSVTGDIAAIMKAKGQIASLKVTATDDEEDTKYVATSLSGDATLKDGAHSVVWDMDGDSLSFTSSNVVFNVACETTNALYCVIDLSAGADASSYPITYLSEPPEGGFDVDEYKLNKLVMRRIEPGSFSMGGQYNVMLTKPFYIGLFEVTQRQYALVTGLKPSEYQGGDKRPVESVSYNAIRGEINGAQWPLSSGVDAVSFMGKLRVRTGLDFDLPTEAQWEYACRAGTTSKYNNGGNSENDLKQLGRYSGNTSDGKGGVGWYYKHVPVGLYLPNAWGLYDMHGNVWEFCLDWDGDLLSAIDPVGPSSGAERVRRGGSWQHSASLCTSSSRDSTTPDYGNSYYGFRLCRTVYPEGKTCMVAYNANGGVGSMSPQSLTPNSEPLLPCAFTRNNYAFIGWATEPTGAVVYDDCAVANISDDVTLYAIWGSANYCVIDLSAGASATSYPVTYLAEPPSGGFNVNEYKTTKLVLRRIEPGSFVMGSEESSDNPPHEVSLTTAFFMGVFEVTQKQYSLVMGENPAKYAGDKRPVERVSYNMLRGSSDGAQWPAASAVDSASFMGVLRARTGLDFDLPSEAKWEYACRAGTTSKYNNGGETEDDLNILGRYKDNQSDGKGGYSANHTVVGSYLPNEWGLYDVHGNVSEWCLDWYNTAITGGVNPDGASSGSGRSLRGGSWYGKAGNSTSFYRCGGYDPSYAYDDFGFRLCLPISE